MANQSNSYVVIATIEAPTMVGLYEPMYNSQKRAQGIVFGAYPNNSCTFVMLSNAKHLAIAEPDASVL